MNKKTKTGYGGVGQRSWFSDAVGGAWRLARRGTGSPAATHLPLLAEMRALTASHMPVLIHKSARCSEGAAAGENSKWVDELESFVTRVVWPHLAASPALQGRDKASIVKLLDRIIAAERQTTDGRTSDETIPYTSRFDSSWAI